MKRMLTTKEILQITQNKNNITNIQASIAAINTALGTKSTFHEVADITAISSAEILTYKVGDAVFITTDNNLYVVNYKDATDVKLTNVKPITSNAGIGLIEYHYTRATTEDDFEYDDYVTINVNKVNANPVLAGTEEALEGIEIGGTKYKVGGGDKLYKHNIYVTNETSGSIPASFKIMITIINNSDTAFNKTSLHSYLTEKGYTADNKLYSANGIGFRTTNNYNYMVIGVFMNNNYMALAYISMTDPTASYMILITDQAGTTTVRDTVSEL